MFMVWYGPVSGRACLMLEYFCFSSCGKIGGRGRGPGASWGCGWRLQDTGRGKGLKKKAVFRGVKWKADRLVEGE